MERSVQTLTFWIKRDIRYMDTNLDVWHQQRDLLTVTGQHVAHSLQSKCQRNLVLFLNACVTHSWLYTREWTWFGRFLWSYHPSGKRSQWKHYPLPIFRCDCSCSIARKFILFIKNYAWYDICALLSQPKTSNHMAVMFGLGYNRYPAKTLPAPSSP